MNEAAEISRANSFSAARISSGLSFKQIAKRAHLSMSALRRYEHSKAKPKKESAERVAEALGEPAKFIFTDGIFTASFPHKKRRDAKSQVYINSNLRDARLNAGLTQRALAEQAGLTDVTINSYESLMTFPEREHARRIARVLNKPVGYLFSEWARYLTHERQNDHHNGNGTGRVANAGVDLEYFDRHINQDDDGIVHDGIPNVRNIVRKALQILDPDLRRALKMYYEIGCKHATLEKIGKGVYNSWSKRYGVCRERVSQIIQEGMNQMEIILREEFGLEYITGAN